jgi:hypothetical protein
MLADLNALFDAPILLFLVLFAGAMIGISVERVVVRIDRERRQAYWQGRKHGEGKKIVPIRGANASATDLAAEQLKAVMRADFTRRALLNQPERRLLAVIDRILAEDSPGCRAMAQVSLGEILGSKSKDAFLAVNSKRVDLLIVDRDCCPLHAVEFQGTGHHLGASTAARDAVKKEALRRAGIGLVEVVSGQTPAQVRVILQGLLPRPDPISPDSLPNP